MATRRQEQAERTKAADEGGSTFTLADVKKLVEALEGTDVTSLVWARGAEKVVIRRGPAAGAVAQVVHHAAPVSQTIPAPAAPPAAPPPAPQAAAAAPRPAAAPEAPGVVVTSPFVGTFYRAPAPDAPPFVEVGSAVKKGQVLCIVEAMKLMNEIEAEVDGKVAEICVPNATPVEFGEKLFRIEVA
jgi:acetyl-CoA carboxylase biotin carboxyl carrier protein